MIAGRGLIANTLSDYADKDDVIIYASGVSNSRESDEAAFLREHRGLMDYAGTKARLVYFSSCSIFDQGSATSRYVRHKKEMEELIAARFTSYTIVRLPLLISNSENPHTFFNFMAKRILHSEPIRVQTKAWRYLFDAEDLKICIPLLLKDSTDSGMINMAYNNPSPVPVILDLFEEILKKKAVRELVDEGSFYDFDRSEFGALLLRNGIRVDAENYNNKVLNKYLKSFK